jgi:hypothetical protein
MTMFGSLEEGTQREGGFDLQTSDPMESGRSAGVGLLFLLIVIASGAPSEDTDHVALVRQFSSFRMVTEFLVALLRAVVPFELWGSSSNQQRVFQGVEVFVKMGRFEKFSVDSILCGFKLMVTFEFHVFNMI